jgi:exosome complex RNA-binding protein Rrp42 (RNase PH superfamily)
MEAAAYKRLYPHEYYEKFVSEGARPDGRPLGRARPVSVARGVVSTADGSTLAKIGRTTALAAVKLELVTPELDAPDEGGLDVTVELPPMCSAAARPGRPSEEAAYCSRRVADALRDAKVVDPKRLCVDEGRFAWRARLDVYVLDHDGCVLDAAILAANGALRDCVVPVVSVDERGEASVGEAVERDDDDDGADVDGVNEKRKKNGKRETRGVRRHRSKRASFFDHRVVPGATDRGPDRGGGGAGDHRSDRVPGRRRIRGGCAETRRRRRGDGVANRALRRCGEGEVRDATPSAARRVRGRCLM